MVVAAEGDALSGALAVLGFRGSETLISQNNCVGGQTEEHVAVAFVGKAIDLGRIADGRPPMGVISLS